MDWGLGTFGLMIEGILSIFKKDRAKRYNQSSIDNQQSTIFMRSINDRH